jgi:putative spermidine/putrescine transport system substrate-binding protein
MSKKGILILMLLLSGCLLYGSGDSSQDTDWLSMSWEEIESSARSTKVTFYMWGGSAIINKWVDTWAAERLNTRYDIELERVPMDASVFVNKLLTEKQAGKDVGTIDLLWINGENFKNAYEASLLYGPVAPVLPNFQKYVDEKTVEYDFGFPVRGFEVPYGRAQFVFEYDSNVVKDPPDTFEKLLAWVKKNPGKFTYPQPPDFTGSAFIRQVFYAVTGGHEQYLEGWDEDLFHQNACKLWYYFFVLKS